MDTEKCDQKPSDVVRCGDMITKVAGIKGIGEAQDRIYWCRLGAVFNQHWVTDDFIL